MKLACATKVAKKRKTVKDQFCKKKTRGKASMDNHEQSLADEEPRLVGDDDSCEGRNADRECVWQSDPLRGKIHEVLPKEKLRRAMLWCVILVHFQPLLEALALEDEELF